ncbi:DUF2190 family protein [Escherichia coli]|nr:DUF2190 family protein [Escherichia coli]
MTLQVEFWTVVSFLLTFMGFVGGLAKWLFSKTEERQAARFASLEQALQQSASNWGELEKEFMRFKADLPLNYVRREDYIRGQTVIEAKLDALYNKLEVVQQYRNMGTTQQVILITTVTAGTALAQQRFVGADNTPCKAGAAALGVAEVDAVTGDSTPVSVLGIIAVEAGAAVSRGVAVQSDAQARAVPQSGDGKSCGIALDEYTSSSVEYLALGVGTPAHSCADAPPEAISGYVVCRTATLNGWEHVPDHRGETVYSTENGNPVLITQPGDYPADTTTKQPATPWDTWNGEAWVTDTERQRTAELEVARQQRQQRVKQAMASVDLINLKLRAGRSLTPEETAKLNAVLDYIDELNALDISTAPEISWPEAPLALAS